MAAVLAFSIPHPGEVLFPLWSLSVLIQTELLIASSILWQHLNWSFPTYRSELTTTSYLPLHPQQPVQHLVCRRHAISQLTKPKPWNSSWGPHSPWSSASNHSQNPINFLSFFHFFFFLGPHLQHMKVPKLGVKSELQLLAFTRAHSHARSLTHWARPGLEPASSWILAKFISAEPQRERPNFLLKGK